MIHLDLVNSESHITSISCQVLRSEQWIKTKRSCSHGACNLIYSVGCHNKQPVASPATSQHQAPSLRPWKMLNLGKISQVAADPAEANHKKPDCILLPHRELFYVAGNKPMIFYSPKASYNIREKITWFKKWLKEISVLDTDPGWRGYKRLLQWGRMRDERDTAASSGGWIQETQSALSSHSLNAGVKNGILIWIHHRSSIGAYSPWGSDKTPPGKHAFVLYFV